MERQFRRVKGYTLLPLLEQALSPKMQRSQTPQRERLPCAASPESQLRSGHTLGPCRTAQSRTSLRARASPICSVSTVRMGPVVLRPNPSRSQPTVVSHRSKRATRARRSSSDTFQRAISAISLSAQSLAPPTGWLWPPSCRRQAQTAHRCSLAVVCPTTPARGAAGL